jgi:hypothetical protein
MICVVAAVDCGDGRQKLSENDFLEAFVSSHMSKVLRTYVLYSTWRFQLAVALLICSCITLMARSL